MADKLFDFIDEVVDAPDKKAKTGEWVGIIIHHTGIGDRDPNTVSTSTWKSLFKNITGWLTKRDDAYLSAHFHVGREGEIAQLVDPRTHISYHAGVSSWYHPIIRKVMPSWNSYAIGIEILGDGNRGDYSEAQYASVAKLCRALLKQYPTIDPRCITGHENIAPDRKTDPGKHFNWRKLFEMIYGQA